MRHSIQGRFRQQFSFLSRQFLRDGELPFGNLLTEKSVSHALTSNNVCWKDRIYTPLVTLWVFLSQVLSADHSRRRAVARLIAHRVSHGQRPCSAETSAYCQASGQSENVANTRICEAWSKRKISALEFLNRRSWVRVPPAVQEGLKMDR